jgi:hypothetical protein
MALSQVEIEMNRTPAGVAGTMVCSMLAAGFAVFFAGCFAMPPTTGVMCDGLADDGVACTTDVCAADGDYDHILNDELCASSEMCTASGCVPRDPACPASCDDGIACTVDSCVSGACRHTASDELCSSGTCRASEADGASGCYTPPTEEECDSNVDCNDGVSCTANRCVSGECRYVPDDAACPSGQTCSASAGCVGETPTDGFRCVFTNGAHRIGYAVRLRATGMSGVRTIPSSTGETRAMSGSRLRLWALGTTGSAIDSGSDGWVTYSLDGTPGGAINTHPYIENWRIGDDPAFERDILNVADLRGREGAASAVGLEAQVCLNPSGCASGGWVNLPDRFYRIAQDTTVAPGTSDGRFWNDPVIAPELRNQPVIRAVLHTSGSDDTATCAPVS